MADVTNREILQELKEIRAVLEAQIKLLRLVNVETIERGRAKILEDPARRKIFDLCDKKRNVSEIAQTAYPGKPPKKAIAAASYHLKILHEYGIIACEDKGGQHYYYKVRG